MYLDDLSIAFGVKVVWILGNGVFSFLVFVGEKGILGGGWNRY